MVAIRKLMTISFFFQWKRKKVKWIFLFSSFLFNGQPFECFELGGGEGGERGAGKLDVREKVDGIKKVFFYFLTISRETGFN